MVNVAARGFASRMRFSVSIPPPEPVACHHRVTT